MMYLNQQAERLMQEVLKMIKNNKYYDTDLAFKYAAIHGGFTVKMQDNKLRREQRKKEVNKNFGKRCKNV